MSHALISSLNCDYLLIVQIMLDWIWYNFDYNGLNWDKTARIKAKALTAV